MMSSSLEPFLKRSRSGATGCTSGSILRPVRPGPMPPGMILSASTMKKIWSASRAEFHADLTMALFRRSLGLRADAHC